jgi:hypothetical protein
MFSSCCDKDSAIVFTTARLPDVNPGPGQPGPTAQRAFQSTEELEIINFGHLSDGWPLRTLLSFRDRTPSALTAGPSSSSIFFKAMPTVSIIFLIIFKAIPNSSLIDVFYLVHRLLNYLSVCHMHITHLLITVTLSKIGGRRK